MSDTNLPPSFDDDAVADPSSGDPGSTDSGSTDSGSTDSGSTDSTRTGDGLNGIDITATDGPNLESGDDLDTGAGGVPRVP